MRKLNYETQKLKSIRIIKHKIIKKAGRDVHAGIEKQGQTDKTRMWVNAQRDGRPAEYRWRPVLNAAKFGSRPLLE